MVLGGLTGALYGWLGRPRVQAETANREDAIVTEAQFVVCPVGKVEKDKQQVRLRIFEKYLPALKGLEGFSHVHVFWWFSKNDTPEKRRILQVHPRGSKKNPLTGVFATRAPVRPNLIATTVCRIQDIEDHVVTIERIDAFDGTPILDLKPYIPGADCVKGQVRVPSWL